MTKEKLRRLIHLAGLVVNGASAEEFAELRQLEAEFEAWEPEAATANGQSAHYWMTLAQQYAEERITLRHKVKERLRWPRRGDRILLVAPHRRAGETATVVGFDKPSDLPGEETLPRVRFADGREMLVHEPRFWSHA